MPEQSKSDGADDFYLTLKRKLSSWRHPDQQRVIKS